MSKWPHNYFRWHPVVTYVYLIGLIAWLVFLFISRPLADFLVQVMLFCVTFTIGYILSRSK